jgi:hypothetical protein
MRLLLDVVAAPRDAVRTLGEHAPVGAVLVVLGTLQALVVGIQGWLLQPAVLGDPLLADAPAKTESVLGHYWLARAVAILLGPAVSVLRGAALAALLQGCAALAGIALRWRVLLSLALHLDVVFWFENLCVTMLLALRRPTAFEELAALRLHAGLDLVWRPQSAQLAAFLEAANVFTVWWAMLVGVALVAWMHGRRRLAATTAGTLWMGLVVLRMLTTVR